MASKVESVNLDFTLNARAVEQAGTALRKELERGLGAVDFGALRRGADRTFKQMGQDLRKALTQELRVDTKDLDKQLTSYQSRRLKIERQLATEVGKGLQQGGAEQEKLSQSRLKAFRQLMSEERKLIRERTKSLNEMNKAAEKYLKTMAKAQKGGGGGAGSVVQSLMGGGGSGGKAGMPSLGGGGKGLGKGAKSVGKITKTFKSLGKIMGHVGKTMAGAAAGMTAAATAIGATVGILAGVVSIFMAADSKMKDLNKTFLSSVGGADLLSGGFDGIEDSINNVRKAAVGAQFRLRSLAKDNVEILKTLNEHGFTMREMARDTSDATQAIGAYTKSMELVLTYSRMIGESASTVAQNMATTSEELGMTLEGVAKKFSSISKFAMESGFSTKRFFSMVIQATSGMSMYNVRLEEASGLLVRIGKILGQKTGGEFLSSLSKGFVNESMQDRMKRVMLTGKGNTKEALSKSAENTANSFQQKLQEADLDIKLSDLGIKGMGDKGFKDVESKELVKVLGKLSPKEQAKATAKMAAAATAAGREDIADGLRQQLQTLISVSEGSKGGLTNMAKNLDALDMGGKLNMLRNSMKTMFKGKEIYELSTLQLAALESATGMSGEQLQQMRELSQGMDGNFSVLTEIKGNADRYKDMDDAAREKAKQDQIRAYGAYVSEQGDIIAASIVDGEIRDAEKRGKDGQLEVVKIEGLSDYYQTQGQRLGEAAEAENYNEDRAIQAEIADNTFSIADMISAGVTSLLEKIYGILRGILKFVSGGDNTVETAMKDQKELFDQAREARKEKRKVDKDIRLKQRELDGETDVGKRDALKQELENMKIISEMAGMKADKFLKASENIFGADGNPNKDIYGVEGGRGKITPDASFGGLFGSDQSMQTYDPKNSLQLKNRRGLDVAKIAGLAGTEDEEYIKQNAPTLYKKMKGTGALDQGVISQEQRTAERKAQSEETRAAVASNLVDMVGAPSKQVIRDNDPRTYSVGASPIGTGEGEVTNVPINAGDSHSGTALTQASGIEVDGVGMSPLSLHQTFANDGEGGYSLSENNANNTAQGRVDLIHEGRRTVLTRDQASGETGGDSATTRHTGQGRVLDTSGGTTSVAQAREAALEAGLHGFEMQQAGTNKMVRGQMTAGQMYPTEQIYHHEGTGPIATEATGHLFTPQSFQETQARLAKAGVSPDSFTTATVTRAQSGEVGQTNERAESMRRATLLGTEKTDPEAMKGMIAGGDFTGGVQINSATGGGDGGGDIMLLVGEMLAAAAANEKITGEKGVISNAVGENGDQKYTVEDLWKDLSTAAEQQETGELLTTKDFRGFLTENRQNLFKDVKATLKLSSKQEILLEKIRKLNEKMEKNTEKDTKKEKAEAIAQYAGLGQGAASRLAQGQMPVALDSAQGLRFKEMIKNDAVLQKELKALGIDVSAAYDDFVYRGGPNGGVITPINTKDEFIGMKPNGAVAQAMNAAGGGAGGGTINVNVYSDVDVEKVKRAVYQAGRQLGIGGRGKTRAGQGNFGKKV